MSKTDADRMNSGAGSQGVAERLGVAPQPQALIDALGTSAKSPAGDSRADAEGGDGGHKGTGSGS